jgi:hypothetical protein
MRIQPLIISLSLLLLFGIADSFAQNIVINTYRAKETYQAGETILKQKDVKQRMASDQASLDKFVGGQALNIAGIATCGAGGIVLLSGVGLAIDHSVKNEVLDASEKLDDSLPWTLVGVGVGTLIPGAILILSGRNKRIKAVKNFNNTVAGSSSYKPTYRLKPASRGVGLALVF